MPIFFSSPLYLFSPATYEESISPCDLPLLDSLSVIWAGDHSLAQTLRWVLLATKAGGLRGDFKAVHRSQFPLTHDKQHFCS